MKLYKTISLRGIATVAALSVGVALLAQIPKASLITLGQKTAIVTMGLHHPRESMAYLGGLSEEPTAVTVPAALPSVTTVTESTAAPTATAEEVIPPRREGGGAVAEQTLTASPLVGNIAIKNNSGVGYDFAALVKEGIPTTAQTTAEPQVLIVHTHACECYLSYNAGYYNPDDPVRSTDGNESVVAVGNAVAKELRAAGIGVVHDTTLHDSPSYTGAYKRSESTVQSYLKAHPTIRVVLDIHRDSMQKSDGTKIKPTVTVNGQKAAQVMAVVGGTDTASRPNAFCKENLRLALAFHQRMQSCYEGIMRPLYVVDARYNQGLLAGSMLLEVGTEVNTLSEAMHSGRLIGKELGALLKPS